jgi:DNA-binding transcriptional LysR family regulator
MHLHHLLEEVLVPVCSPALLAEADAGISLDELPRLHRRQNPDAWQAYAQEVGIMLTNSAVGRVTTSAMLIEAALAASSGIGAPRLRLEELEQGRLVALAGRQSD